MKNTFKKNTFIHTLVSLFTVFSLSTQALAVAGSTFPQHCHEQLQKQLKELIKNSSESQRFKDQLKETLKIRMLMAYQKLFLSYVDLENRMKGQSEEEKLQFLSNEFAKGNAQTIGAISKFARDNADTLSGDRKAAIDQSLRFQTALMSTDASRRAMAIQTEKFLSIIRSEGDQILDSNDFDNFFLGMKGINRASDLPESTKLDENDRYLLKMLYSNDGKFHFSKVIEQMKRHFPQRNFQENDIRAMQGRLNREARNFAVSLSKSTDAILELLPKAVEKMTDDCQKIYELVYAKNPRELIKCPAFIDSIIPDDQNDMLRGLLSFVDEGQARGINEIYPTVHQFEVKIDSCSVDKREDGSFFVRLNTQMSNLEGITKSLWSMSPENGAGSDNAINLINPEKQVDLNQQLEINLGEYDGDFPTQLYLLKNEYRNRAKVTLPGQEASTSTDRISITSCQDYPIEPPVIEAPSPPPIPEPSAPEEPSVSYSVSLSELPQAQEEEDEETEGQSNAPITSEKVQLEVITDSTQPYKVKVTLNSQEYKVFEHTELPQVLEFERKSDTQELVAEILETEDGANYSDSYTIEKLAEIRVPKLTVGIKKTIDEKTQMVTLKATLPEEHKDAKLTWSILEAGSSENRSEYEELGSGEQVEIKRKDKTAMIKVVATKEGLEDGEAKTMLNKCVGPACITAPAASSFVPPSGTNQAPQMNMKRPMRKIIVTPGFF